MSPETILTLFLCFWLGVLGAVLGSFLNCWAFRLAHGEKLSRGRSHCDKCGHVLGPGELVPVFSWLFQKGRCRWCGEKIPASCLAAELAGAGSFVLLGAFFGPVPALGQWLILAAVLLFVSLTDLQERIIPDTALLVLLFNRVLWFFLLREPWRETLVQTGLSLLIPAALLALTLLCERLSGRELLGGGDLKLLFVLALYLNWAQLLLGLLTGCVLGLIFARLRGIGRGEPFPFGPALAAGAVLAATVLRPVIDWYFQLF